MVVQVNDVGMVAQELRIGNYVSDCHTNSIMKVIEIKANSTRCSYTRIDNNQPHVSIVQNEWLKPIPLTEEILLKCGFEECSGKYGTYFKHIEQVGFRIWFYEDERTNFWGIGRKDYDTDETYFISRAVKSLHQLQTLYFALTGKEIDIEIR